MRHVSRHPNLIAVALLALVAVPGVAAADEVTDWNVTGLESSAARRPKPRRCQPLSVDDAFRDS